MSTEQLKKEPLIRFLKNYTKYSEKLSVDEFSKSIIYYIETDFSDVSETSAWDGKWIETKERIPEKYENVIVAFKLNNCVSVEIAAWGNYINEKLWYRGLLSALPLDVGYLWMPLPRPPEE